MQTCLEIALLLGDAVFFYTLRWEQVYKGGSATTTRADQLFCLGVFYGLAFLLAVLCLRLSFVSSHKCGGGILAE